MNRRTLSLAALAVLTPLAHAQSIIGLGAIHNVERGSPSSMSADASIIAGTVWHMTGQGSTTACRWTRQSDGSYRREDLGEFFAGRFQSGDVSIDGSTFLMSTALYPYPSNYYSRRSPSPGTATWTQLRPFNDGTEFRLSTRSRDGIHFLGQATLPEGIRDFVWSSDPNSPPPTFLLPLEGFENTGPFAMTPDASKVVGYSIKGQNGSSTVAPTVWVNNSAHALPTLSGFSDGQAMNISADGSTIIGFLSDQRPSVHAVLWRQGRPPLTLGSLPGTTFVIPYSLSADGSVVVGWSRNSRNIGYVDRPWIWTRRTGILDLKQLTAQFGGDFQHWQISSPSEMSADGHTILGFGIHDGDGESFVLTLPPFCIADLDNDGDASNGGLPDFAVTVADLLYFLNRFEAGDPRLDLDDGSATGTSDQAVDANDLLFFLAHFNAGC